ncbi:MAG: hypothetical protein CMJ75_12165 [Planctomycetaceae bacterium]|nr:hypothetical protein [Planctomycetaceae bacterium]
MFEENVRRLGSYQAELAGTEIRQRVAWFPVAQRDRLPAGISLLMVRVLILEETGPGDPSAGQRIVFGVTAKSL